MAGRETPLSRPRSSTWTPSTTSAAHDWSWIWQAVSGALVLVLVSVHMIANHFIVPQGLRNFAEVAAYLANPVILGLEVVFLVVVTWHGLLGLRAVLFDLGPSARVERLITRVLVVVGVATVAYGLWLTAVIIGQS